MIQARISCLLRERRLWMLHLYNIKMCDVMDESITLSWLFLFFSRSTEEVIALFISIAFVGDAVKGTVKSKSVRGQNTFSAFLWLRGNDTSILLFVINIKSSQKTYSTSCVFLKKKKLCKEKRIDSFARLCRSLLQMSGKCLSIWYLL